MATEIVMPRLGWTMEVGTLVQWLKNDGDPVEAGEMLFSVESDKAIVEVESLDSGVLRIPEDTPIGVEVPVGARLGFIVASGDVDAPRRLDSASGSRTKSSYEPANPAEPEIVAPAAVSRNGATRAISPRARRIATELGVDWSALAGSGSSGRIRERDIRKSAALARASSERRAAPSVRRLADEVGVTVSAVPTDHPAGRVKRADVLAAVPTSFAAPRDQGDQSFPVSGIRRLIAQRMAESAHTVAPVTLTTEADATDLVRMRAKLRHEIGAEGEHVPSLTDILVRLTALALARHPDLNASFAEGGIVRHGAINVGIAVDTDRGLLCPVVAEADRKSLFTIAQESAQLIQATRAGSIAAEAMRGGTFTVSNLGMFEIDAFTPIINLPECAILGVGRVVSKPVVIDEDAETIAVRKMTALSLTFDHRVVDGAPAARFLQHLKRMIESPYSWLVR